MKCVHIADMHFDTSFTELSNEGNLGNLRRIDQRKIFKKMIDYIKMNDIEYLFIAGDLYEHKYIRESTIEYINELFKEIGNTKIFITPGNHDPYLKNSFYSKFNWNNNVHIFGPEISLVEDENIDIYGYGFDDFYYTNPQIENVKIKNNNKINILITHGTLNGSNNIERQYNGISKNVLDKIGFDYVALGHIHKCNYGQEEKIIYPGSMISMGFDELGEHGMIVIDINKNNLKTEFIPLDDMEFKIINFDVTDLKSTDEIVERINNLQLESSSLFEIYLTGKKKFEIDKYNIKKLINNSQIVKIKDITKSDYDLENISNENTLKGIFVKEIQEKIKSENDENKKMLEEVLGIGLEILGK